MPSIEDFDGYVSALAKHDWFFDYSDDGSVWRAGQAAQRQLTAKALSHPAYKRAYDVADKFSTWQITKASFDAVMDNIRDGLSNEVKA